MVKTSGVNRVLPAKIVTVPLTLALEIYNANIFYCQVVDTALCNHPMHNNRVYDFAPPPWLFWGMKILVNKDIEGVSVPRNFVMRWIHPAKSHLNL